MRRPDAFDTLNVVEAQIHRRGRSHIWYPVVKTMGPGVRVVVEGSTHWFLWDKIKAIKEER